MHLLCFYSYDQGGNILSRKEYLYTTGALGSNVDEKKYQYENTNWKDLLTSYDGQAITYYEIGNPLQYRDGIKFTWDNGRTLATYQSKEYNIGYKYNVDGLRTEKTVNGEVTSYYYDGTQLVKEVTGKDSIWYMYDGNGTLTGFELNGQSYYYEKNLQNDIIGIYDNEGKEVVSYTYDAWGNATNVSGDQVLGEKNAFRYRGYYYDNETGFYYLQSCYYDSKVGRFFNGDDLNYLGASGIALGSNLFAYCENNPVNFSDYNGHFGTPIQWVFAVIGGIAGWYFGDYVARKLKFFPKGKGKGNATKYWLVRGGVTVGGAVLFWFAGTKLLKIATKYLLANKRVAAKMPKFVLWFLGIGGSLGSIANSLFRICNEHMFAAKHGLMKLGSSKRIVFNKLFNTMSSKIMQAVNGSNEIRTRIKGFKVTIRFFFKDGKIKNMNAFIGYSDRVVGKLLK